MEPAPDDEAAIFAMPESSSDEDEEFPTKPSRLPLTNTNPKAAKTSSPARKRAAETAATTRPKRQKILQDEPGLDIPSIPSTIDDSMTTDIFGMPSSSAGSQKKRKKTFRHRELLRGSSIPEEAEPTKKENGFVDFDDVASPRRTPAKKRFKTVDDVPETPARRRGAAGGARINIPPSPAKEETTSTTTELQIFPDADFSSSGGTEQQSVFDSFDSPMKKSHKRSSSESSGLSSVDDMLIMAYTDDFKEDTLVDVSSTPCPVCQKPISSSASLAMPDNLSALPYKQQQKFCAQHRLTDAKQQWQERGFPKIYWEELEGFRIREKLPCLKKVISRGATSYYLDQLDAKIKDSKGNRKKLRSYLNEGIVEVVKTGYYGPKGTRIMGNALTKSFSQALKDASGFDATIRTAGIGAYISAVLVPELTVQLVMEDMKLKTANEGRTVMNDSNEIGTLLNPDDDTVEARDEEVF